MIFYITLLVFLFLVLGLSADFLVRSISYLAKVLQVRLFAIGIILGVVTSLPEISVGINTTIDGVAGVSVGNLLGGVLVILGLVLGASLMLNKGINTDGKLKLIVPQIGIIFIPLMLGFDGNFGLTDGIIMVLSYFLLIYYLYKSNHSFNINSVALLDKKKIFKSITLSLASIVSVLVVSHFIVEIAEIILLSWNVSKLTLGIIIFSLGTNLPEISIAITSWRKHSAELSLSNLLGSAFTNVLILGVLSIVSPIFFGINLSYYLLVSFLAVIMILFIIFYKTKSKLESFEGLMLFVIYLTFLVLNFWLVI
jgi:cation:H+ antiporter